ncbi:hypothetical protein YC2023_095575 [Brassica napus]
MERKRIKINGEEESSIKLPVMVFPSMSYLLIIIHLRKITKMCLSPSYIKRISILETVAKVKSWIVMLDLDCDALLIEMFQNFLKTIRYILI